MPPKSSIVDLSLAQQQYVETIAELECEQGGARLSRLAERLGVSRPTASEAVARLVARKMVERRSRFELVLTPAGRRVAEQLERRHAALRRFMVEVLLMNRREADELACRVEHWVGPDFVDRLLRLADELKQKKRRQALKPRSKMAGRRRSKATT